MPNALHRCLAVAGDTATTAGRGHGFRAALHPGAGSGPAGFVKSGAAGFAG